MLHFPKNEFLEAQISAENANIIKRNMPEKSICSTCVGSGYVMGAPELCKACYGARSGHKCFVCRGTGTEQQLDVCFKCVGLGYKLRLPSPPKPTAPVRSASISSDTMIAKPSQIVRSLSAPENVFRESFLDAATPPNMKKKGGSLLDRREAASARLEGERPFSYS